MAKADGGASPLDPATDGLEVPSPKRQKLDQSAEDILMDIFSVQDTLNSDAEIEALADKIGCDKRVIRPYISNLRSSARWLIKGALSRTPDFHTTQTAAPTDGTFDSETASLASRDSKAGETKVLTGSGAEHAAMRLLARALATRASAASQLAPLLDKRGGISNEKCASDLITLISSGTATPMMGKLDIVTVIEATEDGGARRMLMESEVLTSTMHSWLVVAEQDYQITLMLGILRVLKWVNAPARHLSDWKVRYLTELLQHSDARIQEAAKDLAAAWNIADGSLAGDRRGLT